MQITNASGEYFFMPSPTCFIIGINADQIVSTHSRFTWDACSDNDDMRTLNASVRIGSGDGNQNPLREMTQPNPTLCLEGCLS